ncbi:S9 family peptidase [Maricaulis sp.]
MRDLIVGAMALLCLNAGAEAQEQAPSIDDYAALSNMSSVSISPDGERIAFISGESREERVVVVFNIDGSGSNVIDAGDDQVIVEVGWVSNDHLVATYSDRRSVGAINQRADVFRRLIVDADGSDSWELSIYASIANINPADDDHFLVWMPVVSDRRGSRALGNDVSAELGLFGQSVDRERSRDRIFVGADGFNYLLNADLEPRARYRRDDAEFELWSRYNSDGWELVYSERLEREDFRFRVRQSVRWTGIMTGMAGLDATGRYGYFASRGEAGDRLAAYRFDFETRQIEGPIVSSDLADVSSFLRDWRTNSIIGVRWDEEREKTVYFDPVFQGLQSQLDELFPRSNVNITDWDLEMRRVVIYVSGGSTPGAYYLLDRSSNALSLLAREYPNVPDAAMAPVEIVHYQGRDGVDLFGYLTLPIGREAHDLPFVILPHGGPQARDYSDYDSWRQFLASRGYAVFQPQFRGSDGFGNDFVEMGHGQWGQAMQHDVSDAVAYLADQGTIDPDRTCIFGWSYGGYAALAGATLTPELYRCVIAGAPVSDILQMMEYSEGRLGGGAEVYWAEYIGNYIQNRDEVEAVSPINHVDAIRAPIMLIHGTDDLIVPVEQAELMAEAMSAAGKPYEFVRIEDGPHQSYRMTVQNRVELFTALERFLLEHNPPD